MVYEFVHWNIPNIINLAPVCLFADVRDARWSSDSWLQGPCEFSLRSSEKVTLPSLSINISWRSSSSQTTLRKLSWLDCHYSSRFNQTLEDLLLIQLEETYWFECLHKQMSNHNSLHPLRLNRFKCSNSLAKECFLLSCDWANTKYNQTNYTPQSRQTPSTWKKIHRWNLF